jgi:hypothetical protein
VLATPMTTCLVVAGKYVPPLEFLHVLLGDQQVLETNISFYQRLLAHDQDEAEDIVEDYLQTHTQEALFDHVLVPSLIITRADHERGELTDLDTHFILEAIEDIIEDRSASISLPHENGKLVNGAVQSERTLILGCPARNEFEEKSLGMLEHLLASDGCRLEVLSTKVLTSEIVARVRQTSPSLVCIASLPPGGLAQTRYLCKRLRALAKEMKIMVGRWGQKDNVDKVRQRLLEAGADKVTTSVQEAQAYVQSLLPVMKTRTPSANQAVAAGHSN